MSRQGRAWDKATMGCDRGFPCHDIVPLTSCRDTEIVSRPSVAKAGRNFVVTKQHNERAPTLATDEFCCDKELSVTTDFP